MMPKNHLFISVISTGALYPFWGTKSALAFGLANFFIDLDHYIEYVLVSGKSDLKGMFLLHEEAIKDFKGLLGLNIFHTIECYTIVFLFSFLWHPVCYFILGGLFFHHICDEIDLVRAGYPFARAFSFLEYFIRRPHCKTVKDIYNNHFLRNKRI